MGEALAADADALQDAVAGELVEHEQRVDHAALLLLVGDDAADEVRVRRVQHVHQVGQRFSVHHRHCHERCCLPLLLCPLLASFLNFGQESKLET